MGLYGRQSNTVNVHCPRCGASLGNYTGLAFRTAICVRCQKLEVADAKVAEQAQKANQPLPQDVAGGVPVQPIVPAPPPSTPPVDDPFNALADKLMKRVRKKRQ